MDTTQGAARELEAFARGTPRAVAVFRVAYALLTLNFAVPVVSYLVRRDLAESTFAGVNAALGGGPVTEGGELWHMLAIGNVATLALLCAMLLLDLRRAYPALPALLFLKATSAFVSLGLAVTKGIPAFYAVFLLDGTTTLVMGLTARAAYDALVEPDEPPLPLASYALLFPRAIRRSLRLVARAGVARPAPNLFQVALGVLRMNARLLFRSETVGTSRAPVRRTFRARLLSLRVLRLPALLWERAIAPFDLSGLASPPERVARHVLGAHHEGAQLVYDLELLALHAGWLERLRDAARAIVEEDTPRSRWLRDLCVYEGYHEDVLGRTEAMLAGRLPATAEEARDPDVTLAAHLAWCAAQPASPAELARAALGRRRRSDA